MARERQLLGSKTRLRRSQGQMPQSALEAPVVDESPVVNGGV